MWLLVFITLVMVVIFLKFSTKVGKIHGLKTKPVEILLVPARWEERKVHVIGLTSLLDSKFRQDSRLWESQVV